MKLDWPASWADCRQGAWNGRDVPQLNSQHHKMKYTAFFFMGFPPSSKTCNMFKRLSVRKSWRNRNGNSQYYQPGSIGHPQSQFDGDKAMHFGSPPKETNVELGPNTLQTMTWHGMIGHPHITVLVNVRCKPASIPHVLQRIFQWRFDTRLDKRHRLFFHCSMQNVWFFLLLHQTSVWPPVFSIPVKMLRHQRRTLSAKAVATIDAKRVFITKCKQRNQLAYCQASLGTGEGRCVRFHVGCVCVCVFVFCCCVCVCVCGFSVTAVMHVT